MAERDPNTEAERDPNTEAREAREIAGCAALTDLWAVSAQTKLYDCAEALEQAGRALEQEREKLRRTEAALTEARRYLGPVSDSLVAEALASPLLDVDVDVDCNAFPAAETETSG